MSGKNMGVIWDMYQAEQADAANPYAVPMLADSLEGLARARRGRAIRRAHDKGVAYAERLRAAGVVELRERGMLHGFMAMAGVIDAGFPALEQIGRAVGAALRRIPAFD